MQKLPDRLCASSILFHKEEKRDFFFVERGLRRNFHGDDMDGECTGETHLQDLKLGLFLSCVAGKSLREGKESIYQRHQW